MVRQGKEKTESSRGFVVPWEWLSLILGLLGVAALGTLVLVVSVSGSDALAAVALGLAILSFGAQIIVSVSQSRDAASQYQATERVNSETRGLLAQVSAKSTEMLNNQSGQFNTMLDAVLNPDRLRAALQLSSRDEEGPAVSEVDPDAFAAALRGQAETNGVVTTHSFRPPPNPFKDFVDELNTWPTEEEAAPAIETARKMTPWQIALFVRRAASDLSKAQSGVEPAGYSVARPGEPVPGVYKQLEDLGLFEYSDGTWPPDGSPIKVRRLSKEGRLLARVFNVASKTGTPQWMLDLVGAAGAA